MTGGGSGIGEAGSQVLIPHMVEEGWGRIVNISSSSAQTGNFGHTHYSASNAAVIGLTRSLAKEFGRKGITVNAAPPPPVSSRLPRFTGQELGVNGGRVIV